MVARCDVRWCIFRPTGAHRHVDAIKDRDNLPVNAMQTIQPAEVGEMGDMDAMTEVRAMPPRSSPPTALKVFLQNLSAFMRSVSEEEAELREAVEARRGRYTMSM